jgi:hypothetical protein
MNETHHKQWIKSPENLRLSVPYIKGTILAALSNGKAEYSLET